MRLMPIFCHPECRVTALFRLKSIGLNCGSGLDNTERTGEGIVGTYYRYFVIPKCRATAVFMLESIYIWVRRISLQQDVSNARTI